MNKETKVPKDVATFVGYANPTEEQIALINSAIQYAIKAGDVIPDPECSKTPCTCFAWTDDSHDYMVGFRVASTLRHEMDKLFTMYLHDREGKELCRCGILLTTDADAEDSEAPLTSITFPGAEFVLQRCIEHNNRES